MQFDMGFSKIFLASLLILTVLSFLSSTRGYEFYVGGKDGWVVHPSETYNHWAERNRFQVNDTLLFKYKKGSDSVLLVTKEDYDSCNSKNPMESLKDGDSIFTLDHSGPFFFISGKTDNCNKGQKLIVVVMVLRPKRPVQYPPSPSPSPSSSVPAPAEAPSDLNAPAMAPSEHKSSSLGLVCSTWLVLGLSIGLCVMGNF